MLCERKQVGVQGVVHWVGQPKPGQEPARFEARLYDRLFSTQTPGSKKKKTEEAQDPAAAAANGESSPVQVTALYTNAAWYTQL